MSAPVSTPPIGRLEELRRLVRGAPRQTLYATAEYELRRLDQAILAGDRVVMAAARQRWCCIWDELDRRDGTLAEVAS